MFEIEQQGREPLIIPDFGQLKYLAELNLIDKDAVIKNTKTGVCRKARNSPGLEEIFRNVEPSFNTSDVRPSPAPASPGVIMGMIIFIGAMIWLTVGRTNDVLGGGLKSTQDSEGATVSRASVGEKWPLTVDSGKVGCDPGSKLWFETNGVRYGVNGLALGDPAFKDIHDIWTSGKDISPIMDRARETCK